MAGPWAGPCIAIQPAKLMALAAGPQARPASGGVRVRAREDRLPRGTSVAKIYGAQGFTFKFLRSYFRKSSSGATP